ncbi:MAG: hypothetical protein HYZ26_02650 [Chloroflexi bacterium]|nr:hypothetical protein [Chloroflexota bacterium]
MTDANTLYCANHPDRATTLRCNRCNKPICASCAKRTPTGYRCPECIRELSQVYITAKSQDYVVGFLVAAILSAVAALVLANLGWFTIFLSPLAGGVIAEVVRRSVGRRRAPALFRLAAAGVALSGLTPIVPYLLLLFLGGGLGVLMAGLWPLVYVVLATSAAYASLSGIQLFR